MYYHIYLMIEINCFSAMNFLKSSYTIDVYVMCHVTQIIYTFLLLIDKESSFLIRYRDKG